MKHGPYTRAQLRDALDKDESLTKVGDRYFLAKRPDIEIIDLAKVPNVFSMSILK